MKFDNARLFIDNADLIPATTLLRQCSQLGNKTFPAWELNVPSVGVKQDQLFYRM